MKAGTVRIDGERLWQRHMDMAKIGLQNDNHPSAS